MEESDFDQMDQESVNRMFDTDKYCDECERTVPSDEFDSFNGICKQCRDEWGDDF